MWHLLFRVACEAEHAAATIRYWAWSNHWYGPTGAGTKNHPWLATVKPATLRESWRASMED